MKINILIILSTLTLTACNFGNPVSKIEYNGVYLVNGNDEIIELQLVPEVTLLNCRFTGSNICKHKVFGFKTSDFSHEISSDELLSEGILVKEDGDFELMIGRSDTLVYTDHNFYKGTTRTEPWDDHLCHAESYNYTSCGKGTSGFNHEVSVFKAKKESQDIVRYVPTTNLEPGKYFFWIKSAKTDGFHKGYPFTVI